jgi:mRNA-degrading endonuclease RelE of RelBE toxin-antitoxin system
MTKVRVSEQVQACVKSLAPGPKRSLRLAIRGLAEDKGDIKPLEGSLSGWHRLRVGGYRVIFKQTMQKGIRTIDCVYVNRRSVVYDLFEELAKDELTG